MRRGSFALKPSDDHIKPLSFYKFDVMLDKFDYSCNDGKHLYVYTFLHVNMFYVLKFRIKLSI